MGRNLERKPRLSETHLAGVLDDPDPSGVGPDVQRVQDVDHELPHGLKLVRTNAARAVDDEDQVHRAGLTLLLWSCARTYTHQGINRVKDTGTICSSNFNITYLIILMGKFIVCI